MYSRLQACHRCEEDNSYVFTGVEVSVVRERNIECAGGEEHSSDKSSVQSI
jgi:hypothetical protein